MDKPLLLGIVLAVIIGIVGFGVIIDEYVDSQKPIKNTTVFHVTLADPALYDCETIGASTYCKYTETVFLEEGMYEFRFVPNGDSPQKLSVKLNYSPSTEWQVDRPEHVSLHYVLVGNLVEEGMSSWYTWKYQIVPCSGCANLGDGETGFKIDEPQRMEISIDPRGYLNGPVSIELVQIK
ncbi:hypothetical protein HX827_00685 [Marine Group I thaumarchaeote]|uniref:Uncharacterized protein n=1 Tax=Marine Group I thaumarchaeote TaxID=2511932 RepID=A0A7K4NS11_9ARCH|nr:hypothetical protein [Marine Group I thaumarchaeote]